MRTSNFDHEELAMSILPTWNRAKFTIVVIDIAIAE